MHRPPRAPAPVACCRPPAPRQSRPLAPLLQPLPHLPQHHHHRRRRPLPTSHTTVRSRSITCDDCWPRNEQHDWHSSIKCSSSLRGSMLLRLAANSKPRASERPRAGDRASLAHLAAAPLIHCIPPSPHYWRIPMVIANCNNTLCTAIKATRLSTCPLHSTKPQISIHLFSSVRRL